MKNYVKGLMVVAAMLALSLAVGGCNTIEGAGEDVEAAGSGVSGAARDVKNDM